MADIRWTEEAAIWLEDIFKYIAQDNPAAAARVVDGVYEKAQTLKKYPEIGYKFRTEKEGDIRVLLYGHYRIAYLIRDIEVVEILGVFHGALDIDRYI